MILMVHDLCIFVCQYLPNPLPFAINLKIKIRAHPQCPPYYLARTPNVPGAKDAPLLHLQKVITVIKLPKPPSVCVGALVDFMESTMVKRYCDFT